ncbi:MAG: glycosyltransferase family 39 protein [Patescibacteria group bacterium]|nr:glycosyltransferase family 39 protein [Patescibacteria group bacterium]
MLPILNESFWRDEAFSALLSQHSVLDIIKLTARDQSPPLYPILLHFWMLMFGTTEVAIRTLSLLFHFGTTIVVFYLIYRTTKSFVAGLLTAFAVLLNPFLLQYAFEARTYSLLAFLTAITAYAIYERKFWLAGIFMALGIYSHNFALFTTISIGAWWIFVHKQHVLKKLREGVTLFLFPILALISWGFVVWNQWVRVGHEFWIKPVTSAIFLETFESFTRGDLNYPARHFLVIVSYILVFFAASFWIWKKEKETETIASLLLFTGVGPIVIAYCVSILFAPIFFDRYLISSVPLLIVLVAYSLWKFLQENPAKKTAIVVFLSCFGIFLLYASEQILNSYQKPAINWAVSQIMLQADSGDVIIPKDYLNYLETKWYVQQSGKNIPVYAYSSTGTVPYYVGSLLYDQKNIITKLPTKTRYWEIDPSGGYKLISPIKK